MDSPSTLPGTPPADATTVLRRVAQLARLELDPTREGRLAADLGRVLAAFESLQVVDVTGVEPLHQPLVGPGRERDTRTTAPLPPDARDQLLALAPQPHDGFYGVPKTVGE